jgi:acyl-coenzyme A synthetase/AMP-(fatty) acid ligase
MHIVDTINYWARTTPHRPAVIQRSVVLTFRGLAEGIESIGEHIERFNLNKQKPVAVSILSPAFMLPTVLALLRGGYCVAPIGVGRASEIAAAGIRTVIHGAEGQIAAEARNIRFDPSWLSNPQQKPKPMQYQKRSTENPDLIFFTSGTTGLPKKVIQPAGALTERLRSPLACGAGSYQKVLLMPGLTITFGFNFTCEVLNFGKTVCFSLGEHALSLISLFDIEVVVASAAQALALVDAKIKNPGSEVDSIKAIFVGGGKLEPESIARIRSALCRNVINDYGSTEAGTAVRSPFDALGDAPGGIPLPSVETEIVDESGLQVPTGMAGIIRLRTPQLREMLKSTDETCNSRDGWFYPGDIGSLDADGALRLFGRGSDVINRGGFKVSSTRIEEVLRSLPEIKEAAACAVLGSSGLDEIWIGVVPNGAIDIDRIKLYLREHKDIQIAPDEVIVLDKLPRGELGKVQKPQLKEVMLSIRRGG